MTQFDNHEHSNTRPVNGALTTAERARLIELHFERGAEQKLFSDVNLARALHLGATLQELEAMPC
jgi:hypothetical protein